MIALASLGRDYTPVDVAAAMRAGGLALSDSAVLDAVESLRRHSVGAGPLEPLLREPGVTDVLVNGQIRCSSIVVPASSSRISDFRAKACTPARSAP